MAKIPTTADAIIPQWVRNLPEFEEPVKKDIPWGKKIKLKGTRNDC